jgi:1,4-alpha-glucan branching enzyme
VILSSIDFTALIEAKHASPHSVLGMHPVTHKRATGVVARAFLRGATACEVVDLDSRPTRSYPMAQLAEELFEVFIPKRAEVFRYQLHAAYPNGEFRQFYDPYCFLPTLSGQDLYLFNEGNEHRIYEKLGAHIRDLGGVIGVSFAVWAPSAARVSGNFSFPDCRGVSSTNLKFGTSVGTSG